MAASTYERLRDLIVSNALPDSEPLIEVTLADRLGVSRTPVRDALRQLEQDGLVERHGRGLRIRQLGPEEILEIYEVRETLEAAAARAAAARRTELDLSRLEAIHNQMTELGDDLDQRVSWNNQFHETLWRASHNATLQEFMSRLIIRVSRYSHTTLEFPGRWERILKEHGELLTAIRAHDPDSAAAVAASHMAAARDIRLRLYSAATNRP